MVSGGGAESLTRRAAAAWVHDGHRAPGARARAFFHAAGQFGPAVPEVTRDSSL